MTRSALVFLLVSGCGWTASSARETAAQQTCDYYARCNAVGQGKTYSGIEECLVTWRSNWQSTWPTDACPSIDGQGLDACLTAIAQTECNNIFDFLDSVTKCQQSNVCK